MEEGPLIYSAWFDCCLLLSWVTTLACRIVRSVQNLLRLASARLVILHAHSVITIVAQPQVAWSVLSLRLTSVRVPVGDGRPRKT